MKNCINIKSSNGQAIPYIVEYIKNAPDMDGSNKVEKEHVSIYYTNFGNSDNISIKNDTIRILKSDVKYYRDKNDWYNISKISEDKKDINTFVDNKEIHTTNLKLYIPAYSINAYTNNVKYVLTVNTWINNIKIDLGSFIFKPTDTYAIPTGVIKAGNNEYYECIDFDIIDPFYLLYSDTWDKFRKTMCNERINSNNTGSALYVSLNIIKDYEDNFIKYGSWIGGYTNFSISAADDFLKLNLDISKDPLGFKLNINMNSEYDSFIEYLKETYNLVLREQATKSVEKFTKYDSIVLDVLIKSKDSIIAESASDEYKYYNEETTGVGIISQTILFDDIKSNNGSNAEHSIKKFFNDWNNFEDGWSFISSLTIYEYITGKAHPNDKEDSVLEKNELFNIVSNEIPITQELFSIFTRGTEKIIDIEDMKITTYNVVNKIENNIIQIERPNDSKANIVQPVFFRAKDTETLTIHPKVTENISINLDDYKSKVEHFILQIGDSQFNQIGANSYGILFRIAANTLPATVNSGTYYILNENKELVTTGKYSFVI